MRLILIFSALLAASCASQEPKAPKVDDVPKKKILTGKVTFSGLTATELAKIRVIPESGNTLIIPKNQSYPAVDGFWHQDQPGQWFKIPDHGEAWVGKDAPKRFTKKIEASNPPIHFRNHSALGLANSLLSGVTTPSWVPDKDATKCHVPWPFTVKSD